MIKIGNLSNTKNNQLYIFSDLHLDFTTTLTSNRNSVAGNDIVIDTDYHAILNSMVNLLTINSYLVPDINTSLKRIIGTVVSDMNGRALGDQITRIINLYEPRVKLNQILVAPDPDQNLYQIILYISMPNFGKNQLIVSGQFDNIGNFKLSNQ